MRRLANGIQKFSSGVILGVPNDGHADPKSYSDGAFRHCLGGVVCAFGVDIGAKYFQKHFDVGLDKEHNIIHATKRGDELGARAFVEDGAAGPFELADAGIRVDADNENIAFAPRAFEITDMSDVQRVKTTIRKDNALALAPVFSKLLSQCFTRDDFGCGLTHDLGGGSGGLRADGVEKLFLRNSRGAAFHDHQATRDVGDVRTFKS